MISVLYVDDESALLEVTKVFLERGGEFRVNTATSAHEGIEKLKEERYDALVSDYQMPEMDGIEFLKYLRPRCNGMPFILFTGKGVEGVAIEALNAGADFYLQKGGSPRVQFAELETKIRSAVARRQSEQALRQSELAYRTLVENLADVVYAVSEEGIVTYASPRISQFGHDPKDVIGKDFAMLVCAEDIPSVARHFADSKRGIPASFDLGITDQSGQSHRVRASFCPQMDRGRFTGVQGLLTEISVDMKNDAMARRSENLFRLLLDTATDGMLVLDPKTGSPVEFNEEACRQLGYTRDEFAGLKPCDWEVADAPQTLRKMIPEILHKGQATFGTRHRTKEGRIREVVVTARTLDTGNQTRIGAIFHDATDENAVKRTLDDRAAGFAEMYEQAPLACLSLSPDGRIMDINRAGTVLLGRSKNEIIGRSLAEFITPKEQERFSRGIQELEHSGITHTEQFTLARKDGSTAFVSLDGSAFPGPDGKKSQLVVTLIDITLQVQEATTLQATAASAEGVITGARDGILTCTQDLVLTGWNPTIEDITGIIARDALGKPLADVLPFLHGTGNESPAAHALAGEIVATPDSRYEYPGTGKHGWARAIFSPLRDARGTIGGIVGVVQEITARTTVVQRIRAVNRLYAISSRVSIAAAKSRELETLLAETCRIAAADEAICMAWIGLFDHVAGILRPVAQAGNEEDLPKEGYRITDTNQGEGLAGDAVRTGMPVVCRDTGAPPAAQPWMKDACQHGYRSLAAVPFRLKGEIVGVFTLCSGEPDAFSDEEAEQLALLGTTLSSALDLLDKKTLQRRAGRESHGSWERTRFLAGGIEYSSVPFAAIFPDGSTGAVNTALCTMLGYTEDELLALPLTGLFEGGNPAADERFQRVIATKTPERYESVIHTKDGTLMPVEIFLQAMTDETSGQPCTYVFLTNIADRKQRSDALDKERQQYRTFFETASAAMLITTPEGGVLAANPAACRLFGRTEEALRSADDGGMAGAGDPRFIELARTCSENGTARGELRLLGADGMQFDAEILAAKFIDQDGRDAMNLILRDITGQRTAGAALMQDQNSAVAVAVLDSLPNPLRRSNPKGECDFFNKAWLAFTGKAPADETGDGWMEGIHPDDRYRYRETSMQQDNSQGLPGVEYRLRNNAGEYRWIREIRIPNPAPDRTEAGIIYTCFDIHECRQAEEDLEEEKAQYRAIFENITDAAFLVSDRILDCNAAAIRLFACTREDLIGHDILEYSPLYQPDGKASADAVREYLEAAREGNTQAFPWVNTRRDGTTLETRITLAALNSHGEQQVLVVSENLTEQNRAEREIQRLASYPQLNPNPVIDVQPDRTITYTNPATSVVLSSLGLPDDPAAFLPGDIDAIIKSITPVRQVRVDRIVQIKERSFHEVICPAPEPTVMRIYAYDITDRVQAAEALAYANHKLGILTSITRHDIQNKLTGVLGYLDLLRGSLREPQLIEFLDKAESSANAIRHHIDFTKDYESLGGTAPVWQEITPLLADVRSHFEVEGIAFEEPTPGFAVFADPMFAKVLYNLCDNSLRHGVHVRHIRIQCEPADTGCTLTYNDDGVGIPQDKKELIFERGFTTSSGPSKSSGLGLFLVRDILAITGISIKETGVPGMGTRFEMAIPPGKWRIGPVEE
ncbi:MAG: PAS domain S-box protein [Methanoregula sp.]|jgi:PAS domain S-box-containing protein